MSCHFLLAVHKPDGLQAVSLIGKSYSFCNNLRPQCICAHCYAACAAWGVGVRSSPLPARDLGLSSAELVYSFVGHG